MNNLINAIHIDDIYAVLQAIRYARALPDTPLHAYLLARNVITGNMPSPLQDYQAASWLTDLITAQYNNHRCYHRLPALTPDTPKANLIEQLRHDYLLSDSDLEAWSVIFVFYACLRASLSPDQLAVIARTTKRTLRRRQKRGINQLYLHVLIS